MECKWPNKMLNEDLANGYILDTKALKILVSFYIVGWLSIGTNLFFCCCSQLLSLNPTKLQTFFCFLRPPLMNPPNVGSNLKAVAIKNRSADDFVPSYWLCGRNLEVEECLMYLFIICRNALAKLWCLSSSVMHTPTGAYVAIVVVLFIAVCWLSCNIYCNGKAGETHATILPFELLWWLK